MHKPSIAVFGAGLIGRRHIAEATRQASLCAIVDPSPAAAEMAGDMGIRHFLTPQECLDACRPDGVVVATPNQLHAEHAVLCLHAGIPVLIEKPIADTLESADQIVAAEAASGVPALIGHHRRHNPIIAAAKSAIDAGRLGRIVAVQGQFWLYKPDDYFDASWRSAAGAGPTMINFIHDVDLLRHFCGDIADVQAMRSNAQRGGQVEDTAAILMRFDSGALGTFSISDTIVAPWSWEMTSGENPIYPHRPGTCYAIGGTHASLSVPDLKLWAHDGERSWWNDIRATSLDAQDQDAFAAQFRHFLAVLDGARPHVSAREGRESLAAVLSVVDAGMTNPPGKMGLNT